MILRVAAEHEPRRTRRARPAGSPVESNFAVHRHAAIVLAPAAQVEKQQQRHKNGHWLEGTPAAWEPPTALQNRLFRSANLLGRIQCAHFSGESTRSISSDSIRRPYATTCAR